MRYISLVCTLMALTPPVFAERADKNNPPKGKEYTYKESNGITQKMEIFFPPGHDASKKAVPGIILFHGGGWSGGNRETLSYQCAYFASRGLVAATVSYRLATKEEKQNLRGKTSFKRIGITSAKSAIRWFKQHSGELGIDPRRIITGGGSAGGHISLLATTNNNPVLDDADDPEDHDTSVVAYVLFNPALGTGAKDDEVALQRHLKPDFPPAIVFFGTKDQWMDKGWNPVYEEMKAMGIKSIDVMIADGARHGFYHKEPWADLTLSAADSFLKRHKLIEGESKLVAPETGERLVRKK